MVANTLYGTLDLSLDDLSIIDFPDCAQGVREPQADYLSGAYHATQLYELNRTYLDLLRAEAQTTAMSHTRGGLPVPLIELLLRLSSSAVLQAARCPYALFDSFALSAVPTGVATPARVQFANNALFYAWHVLQHSPSRARLWFGFDVATANRLSALSVAELGALASAQALSIVPRWSQHPAFWPELLLHAECGDASGMHLARLLGRQLLAAHL